MSKNITKKVKETYTAIKFLGKGGFGEAYLVKSNMTKKKLCNEINKFGIVR